MKTVVTDKWILCPVCGAKTRTKILDDTELKHFPLFCPKCKKSFIINVKDKFANDVNAELTIIQNGEHWFHTTEQMAFLDDWIRGLLK